VKVDRPTWKK